MSRGVEALRALSPDGLSQVEIAQVLGISSQAVGALERKALRKLAALPELAALRAMAVPDRECWQWRGETPSDALAEADDEAREGLATLRTLLVAWERLRGRRRTPAVPR